MKQFRTTIAVLSIISTLLWSIPGIPVLMPGLFAYAQTTEATTTTTTTSTGQSLRDTLLAQAAAIRAAAEAKATTARSDAEAVGDQASADADQLRANTASESDALRTELTDQASQARYDAEYAAAVAQAEARGEPAPAQEPFVAPSQQPRQEPQDQNGWDGNGVNDDVTVTNPNQTNGINGGSGGVTGAPMDLFDVINTVSNENIGDIGNGLSGSSNTGGNATNNNNGDSLILTGNAGVQGNGVTTANTNSVNVNGQNQETQTNIGNTNRGVISNIFDFMAKSGFNTILQPRGDARIDTGDVDVKINLMNLTNTNVTNSEIGQVFFEKKDNYVGDFDLDNEWRRAGWTDCPFGKCEGEFTLTNTNDAIVNNKLNVLAESGGNEIHDANGDGIIKTGNVRVASNLLNFLNTNMTAADWHLAVANFFGDWKGDLILPGDAFLDDNEESYTLFANSSVNNANDANVKNNIKINSDSGANTTLNNTGETKITTGAATANSNVSTMSNINFTGGDWVIVFVNTFGGWDGTIVNMPEEKVGMASEYKQLQFSSLLSNILKGDFARIDDDGKLIIDNDNIAELNNDIVIEALSGNNLITGNKGDATIITGDVEVLSNIINFVNTNIMGGDWYLGLVNVFGHWEGNVVFGRPDLALTDVTGLPTSEVAVAGTNAARQSTQAAAAQAANKSVKGGDVVTSSFKVQNTGTAMARDIKLTVSFNPAQFEPVQTGAGSSTEPGKLVIPVEKIGVRGYRVVDFSLKAKPQTKTTVAAAIVAVASPQPDMNATNNQTSKSFEIKASAESLPTNPPIAPTIPAAPTNPATPTTPATPNNPSTPPATPTPSNNTTNDNGNNSNNNNTNSDTNTNTGTAHNPVAIEPILIVEKTHNAKRVQGVGDVVHFTVTVTNTGNATAYNLQATDTFIDPKGTILNQETWAIGNLEPNEGVRVQYDIPIKASFSTGTYKNNIVVSGNKADETAITGSDGTSFQVAVKSQTSATPATAAMTNPTTPAASGATAAASVGAAQSKATVSGASKEMTEEELAYTIMSSPELLQAYLTELVRQGQLSVGGFKKAEAATQPATAAKSTTIAKPTTSPQAPLATIEKADNTTSNSSDSSDSSLISDIANVNPIAAFVTTLNNLQAAAGSVAQIAFLGLLWGLFWSVKRHFI